MPLISGKTADAIAAGQPGPYEILAMDGSPCGTATGTPVRIVKFTDNSKPRFGLVLANESRPTKYELFDPNATTIWEA